MTAYELWVCDFHADPPESDADLVNEDTARDCGWLTLSREVQRESALGNGRTWNHTEIKHVCGDCVKDPACREWLAAEGLKPIYDEDRALLAALGDKHETPRLGRVQSQQENA